MKKLKLQYLLFNTVLFLLTYTSCFSQGHIKITIKDSVLKSPIASASIILTDEISLKSLNGFSDPNGDIDLKFYTGHNQVLKITYVGYKEYSQKLHLAGDTSIQVNLQSATTQLADIHITAEKSIIENKHDRMVYRVTSKAAKGKKIIDVMKNIPFIAVTSDQFLIKGNTDYIILKNGNPSNLTIQDLRSMPAGRIDSIELITSPSAQYDGTLKSIINVVFKKDDRFQGGSFFSRLGTRSSSIGASYSNTSKLTNTNLNVDLSYDRVTAGNDNQTTLFQDTVFNTRQQMVSKNKAPSFLVNYVTEWTLPKDQFLGVGAKVGFQSNKLNSSYNSKILPNEAILISNNITNSNDFNTGLNLNYARKISKSSKISFSNLLNISHDHYDLKSYSPSTYFNNRSVTTNKEFTSQLDYGLSFKGGLKTEFGGKFIDRLYDLSPIYNDIPGNELHFNQTIASGYFSLSKSQKKIYIRIGTRFENTNNQFNGNQNSTFNILPNVLMTYDLTQNHSIKLVYRKSISRPAFFLLSNFINQDNPLNTVTGNPALVNEVFTTASLEDDLVLGSSNLSLSFSYVKGKNLISSKRNVESYIINTFYGNFSKSHSLEGYFSLNSPIVKEKLYMNFSGSLKPYYITDGSQTNKGLIKDINTGLTLNASQRLSIDLSANYLGNYIYLQGKSGNSSFMDVMARYQYKNSSFLIQLTNPIINKINQSSNGNGAGFVYSGNSYYLGRGVALAYAFIFGKSKDERPKTKNVENTDLKQEKHL
ncbi:hypothetical protein ABID99_003586 [Mucilaginibacter sp. OAE612]|uniref:outer membrane beta-barrel protein n=1 Tax=Mucilaginibacter sp. OAE612 TaxID=3156444 RepID=UPI00359E4D29